MFLIVGMARSGIAAARLLHSLGRDVFVTDAGGAASTAELEQANIPFETGKHTRSRFLDAEEIVVSPGVPLDIEPLAAARARGVPIISEVELAFRYMQGDTVAVTGSNGKTTTTFLIKHICGSAGWRSGLIGTVRYEIGERLLPATRTTPARNQTAAPPALSLQGKPAAQEC